MFSKIDTVGSIRVSFDFNSSIKSRYSTDFKSRFDPCFATIVNLNGVRVSIVSDKKFKNSMFICCISS